MLLIIFQSIFIVHGLNGGAARTWQHENNAIWFRDFLPETVRNEADRTNARIWTYGYPAVANFSRPVCDMTPFQFAQDLLLRVKAKRDGREVCQHFFLKEAYIETEGCS